MDMLSPCYSGNQGVEEVMPAYLLLVFAVLTRLIPHPDWLNFTAVGGMLLYFGARRSWREMLAPLAALMATDYCLTVFTYHYAFRWQAMSPPGPGTSRSWCWAGSSSTLAPRLCASPPAWSSDPPRSSSCRTMRSGSPVTCIPAAEWSRRLLCARRCPSTATTWSRPPSLPAWLSEFPSWFAA